MLNAHFFALILKLIVHGSNLLLKVKVFADCLVYESVFLIQQHDASLDLKNQAFSQSFLLSSLLILWLCYSFRLDG